MNDDFDPYYKWLAIPPAEQPPNHYRLLGVPLYTDDPDVIENAADQRMAHLRSFQSGKYSAESQRLLNEVATARVCLLNQGKKAEYDGALRLKLQPAPVPPQPVVALPAVPIPVMQSLRPIPLPPPVPPPVNETAKRMDSVPVLENASSPAMHSRPTKRKPKSLVAEGLKHIAASATGLLCGYLVVGFFNPSWDHYGLFHRKPVAEKPAAEKPVNVEPVVPPERKVEPAPSNPTPPRPEATRQPPAVKPADTQPPPEPAPFTLTPEELARQAEEAKQQQLTKLQADRDAAVADGKVVEALQLTAEYAQLKELDLLAEKARVIGELRKTDHPPADTYVLTGAVMEQARHALANNQKELAADHATVALQLARKTNDQDLVKQATKLVLEIQQ